MELKLVVVMSKLWLGEKLIEVLAELVNFKELFSDSWTFSFPFDFVFEFDFVVGGGRSMVALTVLLFTEPVGVAEAEAAALVFCFLSKENGRGFPCNLT